MPSKMQYFIFSPDNGTVLLFAVERLIDTGYNAFIKENDCSIIGGKQHEEKGL